MISQRRCGQAVELDFQNCEVGAGINISPNASRVLFALGLEEPLREASCLPEALELRTWRRAFRILRSNLGPSFEAQLFDGATDLLHEAWHEAQEWAEEAVADAKAKAVEIIESIALLPEAAHQVVRDQFDRKVINMNAKKEA